MKTLRILCGIISVLILVAGAPSYAQGGKSDKPAAKPAATGTAEAATAVVDITQIPGATGTATATVEIKPIPGDRVTDVIKTVDKNEFNMKLAALSMEFEIGKEWFIAKHEEFLKQAAQVEEAYKKCKGGKPDELRSMLKAPQRTAVQLYYVCKKLEKGPEVCDGLKTLAPDAYKECLSQTPMFWFKVVPAAVNPNATEQDFRKTGQEICATIPEAKDRLSECAQHFVFSLQTLNVILIGKDKKLCGGIASGEYKSYCEAVFDRNQDFCTPQKQNNLYLCLQQFFNRILVMASDDKSLISEARKTNVLDTLLAGHFVSPTACDDFIGSKSGSLSYCEALRAQAIVSIDVSGPLPAEGGNNSGESAAPDSGGGSPASKKPAEGTSEGNGNALPKSKPR